MSSFLLGLLLSVQLYPEWFAGDLVRRRLWQVPLQYSMLGHQVETAYERGWSELSNGKLIAEAESARFDVLITSDQSIPDQQNWTGSRLGLLVLSTNDWTRIC